MVEDVQATEQCWTLCQAPFLWKMLGGIQRTSEVDKHMQLFHIPFQWFLLPTAVPQHPLNTGLGWEGERAAEVERSSTCTCPKHWWTFWLPPVIFLCYFKIYVRGEVEHSRDLNRHVDKVSVVVKGSSWCRNGTPKQDLILAVLSRWMQISFIKLKTVMRNCIVQSRA